MSHLAWWKGTRGEWYVIGQVVLFGLVIFGPRVWFFSDTALTSISGTILCVAGGLLVAASSLRLGANLTALPYPKEHATLIEAGPYRLVRHPIYSGAILVAFGLALWAHNWLTIGYALALLVFFDIKSRREEGWLKEKFADYVSYQKRVRKLIPFIY